MRHDLGETAHLIRGLVFGLRPSIAWRLGVPVSPLDDMSPNGCLGWQIGVKGALRHYRNAPDNTPEPVLNWLALSSELHQRKRVSALEIMEALRWSLPALDDASLGMTTDDFVQCWCRNLGDSQASRHSSTAGEGVSLLAGEALAALEIHSGTQELTRVLKPYYRPATSRAGRTDPNRVSSPRLEILTHHRQEWIQVLSAVRPGLYAPLPASGGQTLVGSAGW